MQLLLSEKAKIIDSLFLCELFLQCLPSNVQMILASANAMTIDDMANRIMDVGTPAISFVSRPNKGGDFRKIIWEEVAAALQTQGKSCP